MISSLLPRGPRSLHSTREKKWHRKSLHVYKKEDARLSLSPRLFRVANRNATPTTPPTPPLLDTHKKVRAQVCSAFLMSSWKSEKCARVFCLAFFLCALSKKKDTHTQKKNVTHETLKMTHSKKREKKKQKKSNALDPFSLPPFLFSRFFLRRLYSKSLSKAFRFFREERLVLCALSLFCCCCCCSVRRVDDDFDDDFDDDDSYDGVDRGDFVEKALDARRRGSLSQR